MGVLDDIAATRARLAAILMRPRAPDHRRYSGLPSARIEPGEAEAYNEAARDAFQAGPSRQSATRSLPPSTRPRASIGVASRAAPAPLPGPRPRASALGAAPPAAAAPNPAPEVMTVQEPSATEQPTRRKAGDTAPVVMTVQEPSATEQPTRRKAGDTAPEFLLRTPTSVTPVVDEFFDGVIRRVEGNR